MIVGRRNAPGNDRYFALSRLCFCNGLAFFNDNARNILQARHRVPGFKPFPGYRLGGFWINRRIKFFSVKIQTVRQIDHLDITAHCLCYFVNILVPDIAQDVSGSFVRVEVVVAIVEFADVFAVRIPINPDSLAAPACRKEIA